MFEFFSSVFSCCSVSKSCLTLCNPMGCSMPGLPVLPYLLDFAQVFPNFVQMRQNRVLWFYYYLLSHLLPDAGIQDVKFSFFQDCLQTISFFCCIYLLFCCLVINLYINLFSKPVDKDLNFLQHKNWVTKNLMPNAHILKFLCVNTRKMNQL